MLLFLVIDPRHILSYQMLVYGHYLHHDRSSSEVQLCGNIGNVLLPEVVLYPFWLFLDPAQDSDGSARQHSFRYCPLTCPLNPSNLECDLGEGKGKGDEQEPAHGGAAYRCAETG
jgi:hypothetical protein